MGDTFTELKEHEKKITEIIKEEEASFCKTLAKVRTGSSICSSISIMPFVYIISSFALIQFTIISAFLFLKDELF